MAWYDNERERLRAAMLRGQVNPVYGIDNTYPFQNTQDRQANSASLESRGMQGGFTTPYYETDPSVGRVPDGPPTPQPNVPQSLGEPAPTNAFGLNAREMRDMAYDPTSDRLNIKAQRAYADMLRGEPMAQGREVGPLGVYMAPNWGESLAYIGRQGLGGYLSHLADKREEEVGERVLRKATAEGKKDLTMYTTQRGDVDWEKEFKERQQEEVERAAKVGETIDLAELSIDAIEMAPVPYLRDDGSQLYVGYRLNEDNTAVEPYNLNTGKKVDMGKLMVDPEFLAGDDKSFNEPVRFIDPEGNRPERMLSWYKGKGYYDAITGEKVPPEEIAGMRPEPAMSEAQSEESLRKFIDNNRDAMDLMYKIEQAEDLWRENGWDGEEDVFNWFTKQTGSMGDMFRLMADIGKDGAPTQENMAAAQTVIGAITRLRAGLTQTITEIGKINTELGMDILQDPEVFMEQWDNLKEALQADLTLANMAASPRMIRAFNRYKQEKAQQGLNPILDVRGTRSGRGIGGDGGGRTKPPSMSDAEWEEFLRLEEEFGPGG